jgi:hypothetical protein
MRGWSLLLVAVGAVGCAEDPGPYPEDCTYDNGLNSVTTLNDGSQLGFAGADLVAMVNAQGPGQLVWHDGATTTIEVDATATGDRVDIYAPPPDQGYCMPYLLVRDVALHLRSDDGRLDEEVITTLAGWGYDGSVHFLFPSDTRIALVEPNALQVPPSWSSPQRPDEVLLVDLHVDAAAGYSPYCLADDAESDDPNITCNSHEGVIRFHASDPEADPVHPPPGSYFTSAVGWWDWP